ncbi:MAG TPA: ImcF-related family protein [Candidatus Sulfotelmatobacter sp.]|nr:ImcF-related family protein [Candidatus Sulfotelmatobacter sp.]
MYWVTGVILLIYLVLVYLLGRWLPLHGSDVWIMRGVLALLGLIGAAVAFWYQYKLKKAKEASGEEESPDSSTSDLDALVREAIRRLKQSTLGRGTDFSSLPIVFVVGDSGATKTTALIHSALDPELLAGQVYRDNEVLPTSTANLWYTRPAIFVDPAGAMMGQRERWRRLVKLLQPARFSAAVGKKAQAPRAAIVCFDSETFLQPGASEATVSAARRLSARLQEVSQLLGISFPVYVLFTKVDRISFFTEFVRGMSKDEVAEVLGTTLPMRSLSAGVYADQETQRLTKAFDEIFYSLAERRIVLLPRENDSDKLPAIYEFPRELRKLRTLLVQFLVDLLRPTQLGTNPFLRGFYFTGVRPVVVDDVVAAPVRVAETAEESLNSGATQIFRGAGSQVASAPAIRGGGPRRMPQWVFLTSLFNDILVKDRVALAASGSSSHVNLLRRIGLGCALLLGLIFLTGFTISFFQNRALESRVRDEVTDLRTIQMPTEQRQPASIADLQKLDRLRADLVDLTDWEENGAPWSMRWGLYSGHEVYQNARPVYFDRFRRLLFGETQKRIVDNLLALPDAPPANAPNDAYEKAYSELKAYLITTSYHDKSTKEFLTPVLMSHWVADRDIDKDRKDLASAQFDCYSTELAKENPFSSSNSPSMIVHTQAYLNGFAGIDRYYVQLLGRASQNNRDVSFNEEYPESVGVIVSTHKVKGAFTRGGYQFAQDALKNPSLYMGGEEWVLGKSVAQGLDPAVVRQKLTERYHQDFVNEWNAVLKTSSVPPYSGFPDADRKLMKITDTKSPLMLLFYFVSHNVDPAPAEIKSPFAPVQAIEPPGPPDKPPDVLITSKMQDYMKALGTLDASIHALAQSPGAPDPTLMAQAAGAQTSASSAVTAVISGIPVDNSQPVGNEKEIRRLLEQPITALDAAVKAGPAKVAGAAAAGFCSQMRGLYPFDPTSQKEMPLDQFYSLLAGDEWKKLNEAVKPFVQRASSGYVPNPEATAKPSAEFLRFLSKMSALGDVMFPNGSAPPHFSYTLKQLPSNLEGVEVTIGTEKLSGAGAQKTFVWTGAPENIDVSKNGDTLDSASGPWAPFRFVARARHLTYNNLEWVIENNGQPVKLPNGKIKSYDYQLQVAGAANPFFDMPGLRCVSQVAGK